LQLWLLSTDALHISTHETDISVEEGSFVCCSSLNRSSWLRKAVWLVGLALLNGMISAGLTNPSSS
jgi:hypothetical protein